MVDSGAMENFVDIATVNTLGIPRVKKDLPEPVQAVDGKPLTSGPITENTDTTEYECDDW